MEKINNIKGTYDLLPEDSALWRGVEKTVIDIISSFGYSEIRTPILEYTQLFKRSIGEVTDIVEKEMYTFSDNEKHMLTLRPENTASCVRASIQNSLFYGNNPRVFYSGPMFRHENPQKGRYRQFNQIGAEAFGEASPDMDFEMILMTAKLWEALGISSKATLELNSIGSLEARKHYREKLVEYFSQHKDQLDQDSLARLERNPLRILDSKNPEMGVLIANAPQLTEFLDAESREHFEQLCGLLKAHNIDFTLNPLLVRGLDYYNRTVFEWVTDCLGAQGTICAGGRYDSLVEQLGGDAVPGCGFAMGVERIIEVVQIANPDFVFQADVDVFIAAVGQSEVVLFAASIAENLRKNQSLRVMENRGGGNFKKQLKKANRSKARLAIICGEHEVSERVVTIKDMSSGEEFKNVAVGALTDQIASLLSH